MSLFREQAIRALASSPDGEPLIATPAGWRTGLVFTVSFLLLATLSLCIIDVPRRTIATGLLVPARGLTWVPAPAPGFIEAVHVRAGDVIRKGDPLFRITTDNDASMDQALDEELLHQAAAIEERLQQARDATRLAAENQEQQRRELEARILRGREERQLAERHLALAARAHDAAEAMANSGAVPALESDRVEAAWIQSRQRLQELDAAAAELSAALDALPVQQARERNQLESHIPAIEQEAAALAQRRLELRLARRAEVTATADGQIVDVRPQPGTFVQSQSPQVAILPQGDRLRAELLIPSDALGFVHAGTRLRLHLESFPYQKFGAVDAVIRDVSPVLVPDPRGGAAALPVFRVFAELATAELSRAGRAFNLQPDMRLRAHVILERRKAWEWLFEPLLEALRR